MDYINTSHPNFIGGSKAVELALQEMKSLRAAASTIARHKVCIAFECCKNIYSCTFISPPSPE